MWRVLVVKDSSLCQTADRSEAAIQQLSRRLPPGNNKQVFEAERFPGIFRNLRPLRPHRNWLLLFEAPVYVVLGYAVQRTSDAQLRLSGRKRLKQQWPIWHICNLRRHCIWVMSHLLVIPSIQTAPWKLWKRWPHQWTSSLQESMRSSRVPCSVKSSLRNQNTLLAIMLRCL